MRKDEQGEPLAETARAVRAAAAAAAAATTTTAKSASSRTGFIV